MVMGRMATESVECTRCASVVRAMEGNLCTTTGTAVAAVGADGDLHLGFGLHRSLPALVLGFAVSGAAAAVVPQRLRLDVLQGLVDGGHHVGGLGQSDQVAAAALYRDFRDVAVLFHRQDDFALDVFAQDFGEFGEAGFDLVTNGGSNFILPAKVLYCSLSSLLAAA